MEIRTKHPILQILCKHDYVEFEKPIDREKNPRGFVSLNRQTIQVCIKCGKRK